MRWQRVVASLCAVAAFGCAGKSGAAKTENSDGSGDSRRAATASIIDAAVSNVPVVGARTGYRIAPVAGGSVQVVVSWLDAPSTLRGSPGLNACGAPRAAPVQISTLGGVANVLVTVDTTTGRAMPPAAKAPALFEIIDCQPSPRLQVVPGLPATLAVRSTQPRRTMLAIDLAGTPQTLDTIAATSARGAAVALPWAGSTVTQTFAEPAVVRIATGSAPDDPAWMVAAGTPYAAVTDDEGRVDLGDIPAGTYVVSAWLAPSGGNPAKLVRGEAIVVDGAATSVTLSFSTSSPQDTP